MKLRDILELVELVVVLVGVDIQLLVGVDIQLLVGVDTQLAGEGIQLAQVDNLLYMEEEHPVMVVVSLTSSAPIQYKIQYSYIAYL